ncbi:MAG: hypothetical protein EB127_06650 [Alphaproteobacteria bacterium]|nr:hypothetical protein [Alphaproteobacteria bacterium]
MMINEEWGIVDNGEFTIQSQLLEIIENTIIDMYHSNIREGHESTSLVQEAVLDNILNNNIFTQSQKTSFMEQILQSGSYIETRLNNYVQINSNIETDPAKMAPISSYSFCDDVGSLNPSDKVRALIFQILAEDLEGYCDGNINAKIIKSITSKENDFSTKDKSEMLDLLTNTNIIQEVVNDFMIPQKNNTLSTEDIKHNMFRLIESKMDANQENICSTVREKAVEELSHNSWGLSQEQILYAQNLIDSLEVSNYIEKHNLGISFTDLWKENRNNPDAMKNNDFGYTYSDTDIYALLFNSDIIKRQDIYVVKNFVHVNHGNSNNYIEEWCYHTLGDILRSSEDCSILIPSSTGGHWVSFFVQKSNSRLRVIYIDSAAQKIQDTYAAPILKSIQNLANIVPDLLDLSFMQQDGPSCGPYTVENLLSLAGGRDICSLSREEIFRFFPQVNNSRAIRAKHLESLLSKTNNS